MRGKGSIGLTVAAGVILGLEVWVIERSGWPTAGLHDVIAVPLGIAAAISLLIVPLVVGRWWVVLAMVGPAISLTVMQIAGIAVRLDDGTGPAWNYRTVFMFSVLTLFMGLLVAIRHSFDVWREDRAQSDQPG